MKSVRITEHRDHEAVTYCTFKYFEKSATAAPVTGTISLILFHKTFLWTVAVTTKLGTKQLSEIRTLAKVNKTSVCAT